MEYGSDNDEDIGNSKMDVDNSHSISNIETEAERLTENDHDKFLVYMNTLNYFLLMMLTVKICMSKQQISN